MWAMLIKILIVSAAISSCDATSMTWYAPFYSGGGYCTEATAFMMAMHTYRIENGNETQFSISHHGDSYNEEYMKGLRPVENALLQQYHISSAGKGYTQTTADKNPTRLSQQAAASVATTASAAAQQQVQIHVCHSEPGAWYAPYPKYHTSPCPPKKQQRQQHEQQHKQYLVGRTMFETDRLPDGWISRLNFMDEIWVPTEFARDIFLAAGVPVEKLSVVAEAVDTDIFQPMFGQAKSAFYSSHVRYYWQLLSGTKSSSSNKDGSGISGPLVGGNAFIAEQQLQQFDVVQQQQVQHLIAARQAGLGALIDTLLAFDSTPEATAASGSLSSATIVETSSDSSNSSNNSSNSNSSSSGSGGSSIPRADPIRKLTVFLYVGKFEQRKGIDLLLEAYMKEFAVDGRDEVLLVMLTSAYHSTAEFDREIQKMLPDLPSATTAASSTTATTVTATTATTTKAATSSEASDVQRPRYLVLSGLPQQALPYLYSLADALVVPSHGEGFGRPHLEAMACSVPVLATNWSSPPTFITHQRNGLLIEIEDELVPASGWRGHRWAQPRLPSLRLLLRQLHSDTAAAVALGAEARQTMLQKYALPVMGDVLVREMKRIQKKVLSSSSGSSSDSSSKRQQVKTAGSHGSGKAHREL